MKIGVLDTDGDFKHRFFRDKKLDIRRKSINGEYRKYGIGFTHGEMVCSMILKENPQAEIILYPIISENMKCSVLELIRGIESLIESGVDIINLSVGDEYNYHPELESICKDAQRQMCSIGNVNEKLDMNKVNRLNKEYLDIRRKYCSDCSISRLCSVCFMHLAQDQHLEFNKDLCKDNRQLIPNSLKTVFSVLENNPQAFDVLLPEDLEKPVYEV